MRKIYIFLSCVIFLISCEAEHKGIKVTTPEELTAAISKAQPGDEIILSNGTWKDVQIAFSGQGTAKQPITLRAETAGKVFLEGISNLALGGTHLVVEGLHFQNGYTPSDAVIEFRIDNNQLANHCRVSHCVIEGFNQLKRDRDDLWVAFWGRHNQLDHCYIAGKSNRGPTVRVNIRGNESINNYHQIIHNHFGPRPRKGGPSGETIQIGVSSTSMSPSYTQVAHNLFDRCNGEVEVISSKTNFNEFRNNVFYKCEGSLVTRHGNYCRIDGNYFIGDGESEQMGGIRIINTGHWVVNNYFYNLKGKNFRSPLAVMNGIPKSPLNRYNQVTDVVVAYNSWINCSSPWQFGVGTNISQKDVLPKSEIRSARPIRTTVANNVIANETGDSQPIVAHDKIDGVTFKNNIIDNQGVEFEKNAGLAPSSFKMNKIADGIYAPAQGQEGQEVFAGFDFETITKDLFGNSRAGKSFPGAICLSTANDPMILDRQKYGPNWYASEKAEESPTLHEASPTDGDLAAKIASASDGDIVSLAPGTYTVNSSLIINKNITLQSQDATQKATISFLGDTKTSAFELHPKGDLTLKNLVLTGNGSNYAFASLQKNMSSLYNLSVYGSEISNFDYVLKAYKETFADEIIFRLTTLKDCNNGIELSEETNDKGDYNVAILTVDSCQFDHIDQNVIDYYRGGYDESTIGGTLYVTNNLFTNSGGQEENGILLNTRGIINVDISHNTFQNNPVKLIALLWGAKNNTHSANEISNSGKILVEENLKLKLMY